MIILASQSPRRRELFARLNRPFEVSSADLSEADLITKQMHVLGRSLTPREQADVLAAAKAQAVQAKLVPATRANSVILASDTLVALGSRVFGKPQDPQEAREFLFALAGQRHQVYTSVYLLHPAGSSRQFCELCEVDFYPRDTIFEKQAERYIRSGSPLDKAGAYGIQDEGSLLISAIRGDYYTVMGLPLASLARLLDELETDPHWQALLARA